MSHDPDHHDGHGAASHPPRARIEFVFQVYAAQALMSLGIIGGPDDKTGPRQPDLDGARFAIDMLEILEQKTRGNLSDKESGLLQQLLGQARLAFVEVKRKAG